MPDAMPVVASGRDIWPGAANVVPVTTGFVVSAMLKRWRADREEARAERQAASDERENQRKSYEKLVVKIVDDRLNRLEESVDNLADAARLCAACRTNMTKGEGE